MGVQLLYNLVLVSAVQQNESATGIHISPLCHHRALSRVPCAVQQVLIGYLFYTEYIWQSQSPNSSHPLLSPWYPYICSLYLCLCFCFANRFHLYLFSDFPSGSVVKSPPAMQEMQETRVRSLGPEDPLEKGMVTHSIFLPGEVQGRGSLVGCHLWGRRESDTTEAIQQQQNETL